jgi:peroxiredoxin
LLALVACLAVQVRGSADPAAAPLSLGAAAPDFKLPAVDGRSYSLKDFADAKILVVIFTCDHCPTAQYYEERIKQLTADYKDRGVAVVAISPNDPKSVRFDELAWTDLGDSFEDMKIRAKDRQFNFPYLYDGEHQAAATAYGALATPHAFVFDAARKLRYAGRIDDSERPQKVKTKFLRNAVEALLAGKEPPLTTTKVIGCSVKWAAKAEGVKQYTDKLAEEPVSLGLADADTLKALRKGNPNKFRLVTFWATWCAPCVAEFPEFVTMHRMYRSRDFELVTVSLDDRDDEKTVLEFLKKKHASCRNLIFASGDRDKLIDAFDPKWDGPVPYSVLISPEGKVICRQSGRIDPHALKAAIIKALNEKKPW